MAVTSNFKVNVEQNGKVALIPYYYLHKIIYSMEIIKRLSY